MCGRFTQKSERKIIAEEFYVQRFLEEPVISYNIAPSQKAGIIIKKENENIYDRYRWGLIPSWAKDQSVGNKMINARAETLLTKVSFKKPFLSKRCIVPVDGFFEWKKDGKYKKPYYIFHSSGRPFALAGLWDQWINPENEDESIRSFTIVTVDSSGLLKDIHDRIPAVISKADIDEWLDVSECSSEYISRLKRILFEDHVNELGFYEVSQIVNSPANNNPECIEPILR